MYMDSLTITALVIFAIFFAVFIKYCLFNICGASDPGNGSEDKEIKPEERL